MADIYHHLFNRPIRIHSCQGLVLKPTFLAGNKRS